MASLNLDKARFIALKYFRVLIERLVEQGYEMEVIEKQLTGPEGFKKNYFLQFKKEDSDYKFYEIKG